MIEYQVCPACARADHDRHEGWWPTGYQIPAVRTRSSSRGQMVPEVRPCQCPVCVVHTVEVVSPQGIVRARCVCGWYGPDRTGDRHAAALVVDDRDWHLEKVGT